MKNILIIGSAGFLGNTIVNYFSKKYILYCIDINKKGLHNLKNKNKNIKTVRLNISKESEVKKFFLFIKRKKIFFENIINLAAIDAKPNFNKNCQIYIENKKNWMHEIDVSLNGNLNLFKYFGKEMTIKKKGKIIIIGSDLSVIAPNQNIYKRAFKNYLKPPSYTIIKHSLVGMIKYYASIYAEYNVNVNMVSPGPIYNNQSKKFINDLKKIIPAKRMARIEDIIPCIEFLLNEKNSYMNGQNILIDGGRTII